MNRAELEFYPNAYSQQVEEDPNIPEEKKRELIAAYGPDAGEFAPRQEESEAE